MKLIEATDNELGYVYWICPVCGEKKRYDLDECYQVEIEYENWISCGDCILENFKKLSREEIPEFWLISKENYLDVKYEHLCKDGSLAVSKKLE
jgi:hypothetical protein